MSTNIARKPTIKCSCPRGMFSPTCKVEHHRAIANDINCLFVGTKHVGGESGTGRKRRPRGVGRNPYRRRDWKACVEFWLAGLFDSGRLGKGILIFLIGFLLLAIGSQLWMRITDSQSLAQIIQGQVGR